MMTSSIPATHLDLLCEPVHGVLTTVMPDGQPQSSLVWVDCDDQYVLVNTTLERQKGRNMHNNPRVAVLVIDSKNVGRWVEIRGEVVQITTDGAEAHADKLAMLYMGKQHFYGDVFPVEQKSQETRVIVKIKPVKVTLDAIFNQSPQT